MGDSTAAFTNALEAQQQYLLRLYVAGMTFRGSQARIRIRSLCDERLPDGYDLEVIDIRLAARCGGSEFEVSICDNGNGGDHLPHVFDMFSQVDSALERTQGGLGIGLSLVKGLVELHGGRVEARSGGAGCGSEFVVRLPAQAMVRSRKPAAPRDPA